MNWFWFLSNSLWILGLAAALSIYGIRYTGGSAQVHPAGHENTDMWLLAAQTMVLLGFLMAQAAWNWIGIAVLWIGLTVIQTGLLSKKTKL